MHWYYNYSYGTFKEIQAFISIKSHAPFILQVGCHRALLELQMLHFSFLTSQGPCVHLATFPHLLNLQSLCT